MLATCYCTKSESFDPFVFHTTVFATEDAAKQYVALKSEQLQDFCDFHNTAIEEDGGAYNGAFYCYENEGENSGEFDQEVMMAELEIQTTVKSSLKALKQGKKRKKRREEDEDEEEEEEEEEVVSPVVSPKDLLKDDGVGFVNGTSSCNGPDWSFFDFD